MLITDPAAPPIRVTRDVDAIVQVVSRTDYYRLSEKLRQKGFCEDVSEGAPICRWTADGLILDIMPTDEKILGFGNKWYSLAANNFIIFELAPLIQIKMVSAPYFLITKLAAFEGRGNNDYLMSHDMEDIIAVLDGRSSIRDEIMLSDDQVIREIAGSFKMLLTDFRFVDSISGHLPTDNASQLRTPLIIDLLKSIADID